MYSLASPIRSFCRGCGCPILVNERSIIGYCVRCYDSRARGKVEFRQKAELLAYENNLRRSKAQLLRRVERKG